MEDRRKKDVNVLLLGLSFMLLFTAFFTISNVQSIFIENAQNENSTGHVPGYEADGFIGLGILYAVCAVCNWLAPSVISVLGIKTCLILGSSTYALFVASFLWMKAALFYGSAALLGVGGALLWTSQGTFLTINSDFSTMSRNSGIFWTMLQVSNLIGNTYYYFQFSGVEDIDDKTRTIFVGVMTGIGTLGVLSFFTLLPTPWAKDQLKDSMNSPILALKESFLLFKTSEMLQLIFYFVYTGMELTFWSGVYGPCLGFTKDFGTNYKSMPGLHGIMIGIGEISGGVFSGAFGKLTIKIGRWPIVVLGTVAQFIAYALAFLMLDNRVPVDKEDLIGQDSFIDPNVGLAVFSSLLLGFGDATYNTQAISLLGGVYPEKPGSAFAIYRFLQFLAAAVGFMYSSFIPLYWHIAMLWTLGTLGTLVFMKIDIQTTLQQKRTGHITCPVSEEVIANMNVHHDERDKGEKRVVIIKKTSMDMDRAKTNSK